MTPEWALNDFIHACRKPPYLRDKVDNLILKHFMREINNIRNQWKEQQ